MLNSLTELLAEPATAMAGHRQYLLVPKAALLCPCGKPLVAVEVPKSPVAGLVAEGPNKPPSAPVVFVTGPFLFAW